MLDINILISQMIILFLLLALGYVIYKLKIVDDAFSKTLSKLVIQVTMPAMILASVLNLTERQELSDVLLAIVIAAVLFFILLPVIGFLIAKLLRVEKRNVGLYTFMLTYSNVGFMGFPIIGALLGSVGLFYVAIYNLMFNISIFTLGIWLMNKDKKDGAKFNFKLLLTPGVIVAVIALAVYFMNIKAPDTICNAVDMVGSITSPAAMLIIGFALAKMDVKTIFSNYKIYIWTIIRQVLVPLGLWVLLSFIIKNETMLMVTFILFAMPVANNSVLFSNMYDGDAELAAKAVFITTLFSLITVPLCVWLIQFI